MAWSDVFGMIIASVAVVVTVLSVFVAYLLSRSYHGHIKEIQEIRQEYNQLTKQLEIANATNFSILREAMLAVRAIFDLHMLKSRREEFRLLIQELSERHIWRGRKLNVADLAEYEGRVAEEIRAVEKSILARETELYWLVGGKNERSAHLHALVETYGDFQSVLLLETLLHMQDSTRDRDELLEGASRLRQRLGKPKRSRSKPFSNSPSTGP